MKILNFKLKIKKICWIVLFLLFPLLTHASLIDDLDSQISQYESKRAQLEKQAQEYQQVINQKQGEISSLSNEIAIFNARINKIQVEVNITEDEISQTKLEIIQLAYGIEQTQKDIDEQKDNLGNIIQAIAEYDQTSQLEMILESDNFSDFFSQMTYLDNLQNGVKEKVSKLKSFKIRLSQDMETEEQKKDELEELKNQLDAQKYSLAGQRQTRESLLNKTRGEESEYQNLLANIESQKQSLLGNLNKLREQKAAELARLKEAQEKPPAQYWASLNWYYAQDDPRWANATIGISNSTMGDYGCAITTVAMTMTHHGYSINPGQMAKEKIFYYDLLIWPQKWGSVNLVHKTYREAIDWFRLDREIGAGYPVIVRIQADGKSGGHYVIVHHKTDDGRYVVHDPYFGANIYLSSSRAYIGSLYETTTSLNQMIVYH